MISFNLSSEKYELKKSNPAAEKAFEEWNESRKKWGQYRAQTHTVIQTFEVDENGELREILDGCKEGETFD